MPSFLELPRAANCESRSLVGEFNGTYYIVPLRCGSWSCIRCAARKTTIWAQRVAAAEPERMVTFTRIGSTRDEIRLGMQTVVRYLRKHKFEFEYWGVVELHVSRVPHMHIVQRGSFIPKPILAAACAAAGWGHSDIRRISEGWSAARYCAKHLCHSHGRRWDGRLVRYSRHFLKREDYASEMKIMSKEFDWSVMFGRADAINEKFVKRGLKTELAELGVDWIMNEVRRGDIVEKTYSRNEKKGYSQSHPDYSNRIGGAMVTTKLKTTKLTKGGVKRATNKR
jgi:hypothetical protein